MSIADKLTTIAENQEKVFEAGKKSEYDAFWDMYQQNGTRTDYSHSFAGFGWYVDNFKPKYIIKPITAYMMFRNFRGEGVLEELCDIDFSENTSFQYTFSFSRLTEIRSLIDCSKGASVASTFSGCSKLVTISEFRVNATVSMNGLFNDCPSLENLNITGVIGQTGLNLQGSKKLTHDSLMSIINALKDFSGSSGSYKVTLGNENVAKLTQTELDMITAKGWTYA